MEGNCFAAKGSPLYHRLRGHEPLYSLANAANAKGYAVVGLGCGPGVVALILEPGWWVFAFGPVEGARLFVARLPPRNGGPTPARLPRAA